MLIVVSLRFVARRLSKTVLWYDDWLIIPATVRQSLVPYLIMHIKKPKKQILNEYTYQLSATICFASTIWSESLSHVSPSGDE